MKKKITSLLLALVLTVSLAIPAFASEDKVIQTVKTLGIMVGDQNGNMDLASNVTRAQFVKMMVAASSYKDTVGESGSGFTLYKDVSGTHWASEYIYLAAKNGWMIGYTDGTFRPDNPVTLEEACTAVLRVLGYDSSNLAGSFPAAQLNKAASLGLRDGISCIKGQAMTRQNCATLFYNMLTAQMNNGQTYAQTLGYTVSNGEVDYTSVAKNSLSGPYIAQSGSTVPFTPLTVYRNGKASDSAALNQYDVYYYNEGLRTVWIYTERTSGKITALSPSATSPSSVTVSGVNYSIASADATYQLSALGGGSVGNYVTLLLNMDNAVVGVLSGAEADSIYYGVVQSSTKTVSSDDSASVQTEVSVFCTDGATRTFTVAKSTTYTAGKVVSVNVTESGVSISQLSDKTLSGKVNTAASKLGDYTLSENVKIIDTTTVGDAIAIEASRLAGCSLSSSQVRYYTLDDKGNIENLILNDVTGDTWTYVYMKSVEDNSTDMSINVRYSYLLNGKDTVLSSSGTSYPVSAGGAAIRYNADGSIKTMRNMESVKLTELGSLSAMAGTAKYTLADDVQVYLRKDGVYYLTSVSAVNTEDYTLTGWYDNFGCSAGGRIRLIIAVEK